MGYKRIRNEWWTTTIDQPYYEASFKHCGGLKSWCDSNWSNSYMTWDEILDYKEDKLATRHRLIFWLCRLWKEYEMRHEGDGDQDIPYVYDELLK